MLEILKIEINDFGGSPFVEHNYPCPIYHNLKAVRIVGNGYFQPSWKAQKEGYKIVKLDSIIQRFLYKMFFKKELEIGLTNRSEDD